MKASERRAEEVLAARDVRFEGERLVVELSDGRAIAVPLAWFPRLQIASPEERENWTIGGAGIGIHWPAVDEDLSVEGLLRGEKAPNGKTLTAAPVGARVGDRGTE